MKGIEKNFIEAAVFEYLEKSIFSPEAIDKLAKKITEYQPNKFRKLTVI